MHTWVLLIVLFWNHSITTQTLTYATKSECIQGMSEVQDGLKENDTGVFSGVFGYKLEVVSLCLDKALTENGK